jgi:glycine/D-amino acid oxidase-like deaminating enzyme
LSRRAIVVGGGFYGAELSLKLRELGYAVTLLEREGALLKRASFANQARVHGGYHYPRSITTGLRSQANYKPWKQAYAFAVVDSFTMLYAVARRFSHVTAAQFEGFCERIGAPLRMASQQQARLFDPAMVEAVYEAEECAFDGKALREHLAKRLGEAGVDVRLNAEALAVEKGSRLRVRWTENAKQQEGDADHVFLCLYSRTNELLRKSGLERLPLRFEMTEMALVQPPPELQGLGFTVMCGPFFSLMPHPGAGAYSLSHVRYTPHCSFSDEEEAALGGADPRLASRHSRFAAMERDASRFVPLIAGSRQTGSLWEAKALLPRNEADDGRPILFRQDHALPGLHCVLGGKIDNIFDVLQQMDALRAQGAL